MHYVRKLGFEEQPDYDFLRELFTKVLKNIGEVEDGMFDWMLLNGGKGFEAGQVRILSLHTVLSLTQTLQLPREATHREHRTRDREHAHRRSRQPLDPQSPGSPLVSAPSPAVVKTSRRAAAQQDSSRMGSREQISVQPLAPNSRRASQHRVDQQRERERESALVAQHPYASASNQNGYNRNTGYSSTSPVQYNGMGQLSNGHANSPVMPNSSEFMYGGQQQRQANGDMATTPSRANGMSANKAANGYGEQNAMADQDGHGEGRKKSFWAAFCCRA